MCNKKIMVRLMVREIWYITSVCVYHTILLVKLHFYNISETGANSFIYYLIRKVEITSCNGAKNYFSDCGEQQNTEFILGQFSDSCIS